MTTLSLEQLAQRLREAESRGQAIEPLRDAPATSATAITPISA